MPSPRKPEPEPEPEIVTDAEVETEPVDIEFHASVGDFVGRTPGWLMRSGNTLLFAVFMALLLGAWLIRYPDVVSAPVTITTQRPPAPVVARSDGRLVELWIAHDDQVERGAWLAVIENGARTGDIKVLAAMLEAFTLELDEPVSFDAARHQLGASLELGELQVEYAALVAAWRELRATADDPYFAASEASVSEQLDVTRSLAGALRVQRRGLGVDVEQARRDAKATERLIREGAVPARERSEAALTLRERERAVETMDAELLRGAIDRVDLDRARLQLDHDLRERRRERLRAVYDAYAALSRGYERWRRDYLLVAPIAGRVSLDQVWSEQQWVAEHDEVMTVIPTGDRLVGRVSLAQLNSGKVEVGQRVLIKLDGYPYREYGLVEGELASVPAIAREEVYLVTVALPDGLRTSHGQVLELRHDMRGTADIVAADRRLIERLFHQLRGLLTDTGG